jgi:hypothetical protein
MDGIVKEMSTQANSESAFQNMVEDLGMQYRYISTADVEGGILGRGEFKVVMLPYTQIVTPKEASAIEAFVRGGGSVIADLRTGTFSTAGKPLSPGTLDELFGIGRSGPRALPQRGTVTISGEGLQPCELVGVQVDGSIVAKTATALGKMGDTPCLLVNNVGKGKAILCNLGVGSYDFLLKRNQLGPAREAFAALLAQAGARSRFVVTSGGKAVPGVELAVFKRGDAQYLTAEKRSFEYEKYPMSAEIALDGQYYVTDLRSGKSLGRVNHIPVQFEGLSCHVWSMLPYQVTALNVNLPKTVKQGSDLKIEVALKSSAPAAPQVVRIEMTSPSGATPIAMRLLDTQRGSVSCALPIAFNEEKGTWQVAVTDISSGLSKTLPVEVTRP